MKTGCWRTESVGCLGVLAIAAVVLAAAGLVGCGTVKKAAPVLLEILTNAAPAVVSGVASNVAPVGTQTAAQPSGPLVDPPPPYTDAYMTAHAESEECGLEAQDKIIVRAIFLRGASGRPDAWTIASLARGHVRRGDAGIDADDWTADGYAYHWRGGFTDEPQDAWAPVDVPGNRGLPKWIVCEIRKVTP